MSDVKRRNKISFSCSLWAEIPWLNRGTPRTIMLLLMLLLINQFTLGLVICLDIRLIIYCFIMNWKVLCLSHWSEYEYNRWVAGLQVITSNSVKYYSVCVSSLYQVSHHGHSGLLPPPGQHCPGQRQCGQERWCPVSQVRKNFYFVYRSNISMLGKQRLFVFPVHKKECWRAASLRTAW